MLVVPVSEDLLQSGVQSEHQLLQVLSLDLRVVVGRQYEWDGHLSILAGALRFSDLEYSAALFSSRHCNRTNVSGSGTTTFWNFSLDSVLRYSLFPAGTESPLNRKNIDGSRVKGDREHEFFRARHKRYFRGDTRAFGLQRRTLNVRRRGYEGLYRRHWLSVEKTHVAREERNAPTSWRKSWSADLRRSSK